MGFYRLGGRTVIDLRAGFVSGSVALLCVLGTACSDAADASDPRSHASSSASGSGGGGAAGCPMIGATQCVGTLVQTCEEEGGSSAWSDPASCPGEQNCRDGACADPTETQLAQAATMEKFVDQLVDHTAWSLPIDGASLKASERAAIVKGDGTDAPFFASMRRVQLAVPQGHQSLYLADPDACKSAAMFYQNYSRFGVCGRPFDDDVIVTFAEKDNPLGLGPGDRIVAADDDTGHALLENAALRPVCGVSSPSDSNKRTAAAASFFGTVPAGTKLAVAPADGGAQWTVTVPEQDGHIVSCQDPLGRDIAFNASATVRPDGVAVIRLPRFFPLGEMLPTNPTPEELQQFIDAFQQKILDEFVKVEDAPAIVWDARSNYGGITAVGLAIAGGMPTAQATSISYCTARIPKSNPPAYYADHYAIYDVVPGGPFAYSGKVAVIIDGLDYSAADYFPLAIRKATTTVIVGTPSAGAYGGPGALLDLSGPPPMMFDYDMNRCLDAATGEPLEGKPTEPDVVANYDPEDLANGIDTVLEAAVAAVK